MNLFNPVGQADLNSYYEAHSVEPMSNISPEKSKYLGISDLQKIMKEEVGQTRIKNENIQQKTEDIQNEFDSLMNELISRRQNGARLTDHLAGSEDLIDGYFVPGADKKHKSPTKRLISLKNSTWDHKKRISTQVHKGDYS